MVLQTLVIKKIKSVFKGQYMSCKIPMIDIELVRGCNLNCRWCSVKNKKDLRFMSLELFTNLISECAQKKIGYRRFSLFLGGESLLHPDFIALLEIMKKHNMGNLGFENIQLFTNGNTKPELYEPLIRSELFTLIRFSVDGVGDQRSYEYMRPNAKWDVLVGNIKLMLELRNKFHSRTSIRLTTLIPHQSFLPFEIPEYEEATAQMNKFFLPLGIDEIGHRKIGTLVGENISIPDNYYSHQRICLLVKDRKIAVNYDGTVSTCSNDLNSEQLLGDVKGKDIERVWNSKAFRAFYQAKKKGEKYPHGYCKDCDRNNN